MIRFKDIHIPKPCAVDYDSLPYDEVKRFCGSCQKHVYDFRGKDEAYFNSIIQTHGKVCGVFYTDDIQINPLKIKRPFYYVFAAKIFGLLLFIKTVLSSDYLHAAVPLPNKITQQSTDSTGVELLFTNRPSAYNVYLLDIFINNVLYKSGHNLDNGTGFIWLPDSLKENDAIRIVVKEYKESREPYKIHHKEYSFSFKESDKIRIKIKFHKLFLHKRKRATTAGIMDC